MGLRNTGKQQNGTMINYTTRNVNINGNNNIYGNNNYSRYIPSTKYIMSGIVLCILGIFVIKYFNKKN